MNSKEELLYVAQIGKSVGLNGDLRLHIESDFIEQFKKDAIFFDKNYNKYHIQNYNPNRKIVKFKDISTIELAQKLTNIELYTSLEETIQNCKLRDEEYFYFDIVGCKIIEHDITLGTVSKIDRFCNSDFLLIQTDKHLVSSNLAHTFLVPYEKHYIKTTDINTKIITVEHSLDILEQS